MQQYRFKVRNVDATLSNSAENKLNDLAQAVARVTMTRQATRAADTTYRLVESVPKIVDGAGYVVATMPIGEAISLH